MELPLAIPFIGLIANVANSQQLIELRLNPKKCGCSFSQETPFKKKFFGGLCGFSVISDFKIFFYLFYQYKQKNIKLILQIALKC